VTSGLENLRDLVHQNMIPALERCAVILSRLLGIARYHGGAVEIGFSSAQISRLMDIVSCLMLVSNKILIAVMEELELFTSFSSWLRFEIDRLASPSQAEELPEKEATMDHSKVLTYIQHCLVESPMTIFFDKVGQADWTKDWQFVEDGPTLLEMLDVQLQKNDARQPHMKAFPKVEFLVDYLSMRANTVFKDIAEAEKRSVRFGKPVRLSVGSPVSMLSMCMSAAPKKDGFADGIIYTATSSDERTRALHIFQTKLEVVNGISTVISTHVTNLDFTGAEVLDLKFLGHESLLVLMAFDGRSYLISIPVASNELRYSPYSVGDSIISETVDFASAQKRFWCVQVPGDHVPSPMHMEVVEQNNSRGDIPARVCLLDSDRLNYQVFLLPNTSQMLGHEE